MRAATEDLVSQVIDSALLKYSENRFISDEEASELTTEIIGALKKFLIHDQINRDNGIITLTLNPTEIGSFEL